MSVTVTSQPPPLATPEEKDLYDELEALCQLVELGQGRFTLALVEYDLPRKCAEVISEIREQFSNLNLVEVTLSSPPPDAPPTYSVLDQLTEFVRASSPDKPPDALIITGLETLLPSTALGDGQISDELRRAIQPLNLGRNILAETFPCPILLCLPKAAMEILLTSAPDIVSWKSGFFIFESDLEKVRAEIDREAHVKVGWLERCRLRRLAYDELMRETKRLAALIADARTLLVEPLLIARLNNRLGWTAAALGDGSVAQQSFAEMLRLAREANDAELISAAEKGLRRAEKLQSQWRRSLKHAVPQQSFLGAAALSAADGLFGRETELQELLLQVTRVGNRFVTVWGETGCGKTSLVLAGVVPELEKQGYLSVVVREWEHPSSALRGAIEKACDLSLSSSGSLRDWLQAATQKTDKTIVVVCDQFEQFFTKHPQRQEREPLLKEIGACLNDFRLPCKFIFILREDYLGRMVELEKYVGDALDKNKRFYLSLFDQATAFRVMRKLSDTARLSWPDVFLNEVIKDLTQDGQVLPIELQLVGAALATLNINDEQVYSRAGRAEGLLADYLQATLESLSGNKRELQNMKRVMLALIEEPHERLSLTAEEIAAHSEVNLNSVRDKLNKLISANLVSRHTGFEEDKENDSEPVLRYELMHDVLVDSVLRLTRDIQDKRRQAKKILTRALEDVRVNPQHTIGLLEWRLLRKHLPAKNKADAKVKSLLKRSLYFGRAQRSLLGVIVLLPLFILVQNTLTHITIEQDFDNRLVIRRGLFQGSVSQWVGSDVLLDTGFTAQDVASEKISTVQGIYLWGLDNNQGDVIGDKRFYESLASPAKQGKLLYILGHKDEGLSKLFETFKRDQKRFGLTTTYEASTVLAAVIEADPSLARPAFDTLLPLFRDQKDFDLYGVGPALAVAIEADPSLARPAFDTLLPLYKQDQRGYEWYVMSVVMTAAVKADPSLARPAFDILLPLFRDQKKLDLYGVGPALAAAIEADPSLARPAFDTLLPVIKENQDTAYKSGAAIALAGAIKADPSLARPVFDTLLVLLKQDQKGFEWYGSTSAITAAIKADPSLARPAFDILLPLLKPGQKDSVLYGVGPALAAAIKADPSLARPAFDTLLPVIKENQEGGIFRGQTEVLGNCIAVDKEVRSIAQQLFTDHNYEIRQGVINGFAKYLATLAKEEAKSGRDPVQFLLDHLEGKQSLMPKGNANTYAVYRETIVEAMARWMASKRPEAVAAQATLKQRLETMRDQDLRLHLRIAAWDALAAAAYFRDMQDSDDFDDFDA